MDKQQDGGPARQGADMTAQPKTPDTDALLTRHERARKQVLCQKEAEMLRHRHRRELIYHARDMEQQRDQAQDELFALRAADWIGDER